MLAGAYAPPVRKERKKRHAQPLSPRRQFLPQLSHYFRIILATITLSIIGLFVLFLVFFPRTWAGKEDRNIVIVPSTIDGFKGKIIFAHISPGTNKISVVTFPGELPIEVIGGYGQYPLQSLFPLFAIEKKDQQFLRSAYSLALQEVVDDVWTTEDKHLLESPVSFSTVTVQLLENKLQSSLSLKDKVWLFQFVHGLRPDQITVTEVSDLSRWPSIQDKIQFPGMARDCSISVVNASNLSGIGARVGSVVEKSGFSVVRVTDSTQVSSESALLLADSAQDCQEVITHVQHILPFVTPARVDPKAMSEFRSRVVIWLGSDVSTKLQKN